MATYADTFDRANGSNISTGAPFPWTEVEDNSEILTNAWHEVNTGGATLTSARMDQDVGSADHVVQCTIRSPVASATSLELSLGVGMRWSTSATTYYTVQADCQAASLATSTILIKKNVAGTYTNLSTGTAISMADGDTLRVVMQGSTITVFYNGVQVVQITDTSITTGTRGGATAYRAGTSPDGYVDNFSISDLSSALDAPGSPPGFLSPMAFPFAIDESAAIAAAVPAVVSYIPTVIAQARRVGDGQQMVPPARRRPVYLGDASAVVTNPSWQRRRWMLLPRRAIARPYIPGQPESTPFVAASARRRVMPFLRRGVDRPHLHGQPHPMSPPVVSTKRRGVWLLRGRVQPVMPVVQTVQVPTLPLPVLNKRAYRGMILVRGRRWWTPNPQDSLAGTSTSRRLRGWGLRRSVARTHLPGQAHPMLPTQSAKPRRPVPARRARVWNFVQSQVVIPRAPDWIMRPHRQRGWWLSRGKRVEFPTPQATAPIPVLPLPVVQKRAYRGWLVRRGRRAEATASTPAVLLQMTPRRRAVGIVRRLTRSHIAGPPHPVAPSKVVLRRQALSARRGRTTPLNADVGAVVPPRKQPARRGGFLRRGRRGEVVVPPAVVIAPPYPVARPTAKRRLLWRRVGRMVFPWRITVAPSDGQGAQRVDFTDASVEVYTDSARVDFTDEDRTSTFDSTRVDPMDGSSTGESV